MSSKHQTSPEPHTNGGEPSNNRRNLLKAAASVAPFVGTLPSGAALANASSVQCALNEQLEAAVTRPTQARTEPDNYYRVPARAFTQRVGGTPQTVYQFTPLGGTAEVRVDVEGNLVPMVVPPPITDPNIYLLIMYIPKDNPLTELVLDPNDPTLPGDCNIPSSNTDFSAPSGCIYPIAKLEGGEFGNMGMTASCLASFA